MSHLLKHRWRSAALLAGAGFLLLARPLSAATASAGASPSPKPAALPASSPAPSPAANDPALFAAGVPTNSGPATAGSAPPSTDFATNLLRRLVQRGILSQADADDLTKKAQDDAATARAQSQADAGAAAQAMAAQIAQHQADMTPPPPSDDEVRVPYIPQVVKDEMTEQIKHDVLAQAQEQHWAAPNAIPEWVPRVRLTGDIRTRYEGAFLEQGNDNTGAFPNFNAINTGSPFDTTGNLFSPQYNVDQNRTQFRLRARVGAEVDLLNGWTAGIRIATGQTDSPVSENQTIGLASGGQGGDFAKYSIWLDRAFLKYEIGGTPEQDFTFTIGRMDNPFFSTPLIWANDLGFDGVVAQGHYQVLKGVVPFLTAGAFPVFNTDFNFATNQPAKYISSDKYLFAGQLGTTWNIDKDFNLKVAGSYYHFYNIEGKLSAPFVPLSTSDQGSTDDTRPAFAQNGNTYFPIRNIVPTAQNNFGTIDQFQYYGLATPFHELAFTGQLNYDHFSPFRVSLTGEYVKNVAFDATKMNAIAVNNRAANSATGVLGGFDGGNTAWIMTLRVGKPALEKLGDWSFSAGYRYVETDAVVDGFNDSDFGFPLTGTNLKGYTITGSLALGSNVWLGLQFFSAESIVGAPYKSDILQIDLNGKF